MEDPLYGAPGRWCLWRCMACGAAYLDPRPAPHAIGRAYPRNYYTHNEPVETRTGAAAMARKPSVVPMIAPCIGVLPLVPRSARNDACLAAAARGRCANTGVTPRLLDVGCGSGALLARMRARGWEAEGIDIDSGALRLARAARLPVRHATLSDLGTERPLRRFDVIVLDHVLEHLHDPVASLRAARQLLRPGGVLWLATPNLTALGHRSFTRSWIHLDPPRHLVLFSPGTLRFTLRSAGFDEQVEQPTARTAYWVFARSAAIGKGTDADALSTRSGGLSLRLKALLADLMARSRPELAEEIVIAAPSRPSRSAGMAPDPQHRSSFAPRRPTNAQDGRST